MRQTIALIVSILLGLVAVFAMRSYINKEKKIMEKPYDLVSVAVAKRQLPKGTVISQGVVTFRQIPVKYAQGMVHEKDAGSYYGKELIRPLNRNDPVWRSDVVAKTIRRSPLQKGERLITLNVNQESGVAGLIRPKSRLDVIYTAMDRKRVGGTTTATQNTFLLLSRVPVYAIDNKTEYRPPSGKRGASKAYSSITLIVSPTEASLLIAAQSNGELTFVLRSDSDPDVITNVPTITQSNLEKLSKEANQKRKKQIK